MDESLAVKLVWLLIAGLGTVAWVMIRKWANTWETRLLHQDRRLDLHNKRISDNELETATLKSDVRHIKETSDETRADVKEILRKVANVGAQGTR